jgi:peptide/nickel transport system substrate-binding protein
MTSRTTSSNVDRGYWSRLAVTRRRALAAAAGSALAVSLATACSSNGDSSTPLLAQPANTSKQARYGGVVRYYAPSDPTSFDSASVNATGSIPRSMACQVLMRFAPGVLEKPSGELAADLAESWEFSPDKLQVTLKLRQGVTWHNKPPVNGRLLDVDDIVFSAERASRMASTRAEIFTSANPAAPIVSISATDARTIVVKLNQPAYYVMGLLAQNGSGKVNIMPKETDTTFDSRRDLIGTGPFALKEYRPSAGMTFERNRDFFDQSGGYVDQIELPIVTEYATGIAQFKAGNIYTYDAMRGEDILPLKREIPELNLYQTDINIYTMAYNILSFGWLPEGKSPFLDERVRQAVSMSIDRDLWLDTSYNIPAYESQGLPVRKSWHSAVLAEYDGWLDPRSRDFGANAKYFRHDVAEAKKLLAAAGYPNGFEVASATVTGSALGFDYARQVEITDGMIGESGIRSVPRPIDYASEYVAKYRSSQGRFEGWLHRGPGGSGYDAITRLKAEFHSHSGDNFYGYSAAGKSDGAGDPYVDSQIEKGLAEIDRERRNAIAADLQRHLAKAQYHVKMPGGASGFKLAWPILRNFQVFRSMPGSGRPDPFYWWLDETQPPLGKG